MYLQLNSNQITNQLLYLLLFTNAIIENVAKCNAENHSLKLQHTVGKLFIIKCMYLQYNSDLSELDQCVNVTKEMASK